MPKQALVTVEQMSIRLGGVEVVSDLDFSVHHNEILGIVGESGSGKSVTAMSLMGLLPNQGESLRASRMDFAGQSLIPFDEKQFQALRGKQMGMVFQDPMSALNPSIRCGKQVLEMLDLHSPQSKKDQQAFMLSLLNKVKLPDPKSIANRYPHQLSGGQQQRVLIAIAIACNPKLLIADEPTTALDPEVQEEIMALLKSIQLQSKMSIVLISHDLNLVQRWADRVLVLNKGVCEEVGTAKQLFQRPQSPYTKGLINAVPPVDRRPKRLQTVQDFINGGVKHPNETTRERKKRHKRIYQQPPILEVKGLEKIFRQGKQSHRVLGEIDFSLYPGETLGLVGSSGSGKSTLGNCLLKLTHPDRGEIYYSGTKIDTLKGEVLRQYRKDVQLIFQDPFSSLNPKQKVEKILTEPMLVHNIGANKAERIDRAVQLLKQVGLEAAHMNAYPHMFSGGQRQRIGIARALAVEPKLVVCDESVSALDRSVQAQVLNLLNELKETYGFTYLFIAHDLEVVRYMSDRILHLQNGNIMILDEADIVYQQIRDHQTQKTS
ncbi:MAG: dipeptide ABC transporter ATP-binding protein [Flavobacteriaceae bacterium]|jgi:peptide/nickel transport system ATP-binding protein|tara:strand:+ start:1820 stop:3460 length:1641 start_codon:yes stop_codon:yes gene_type:complete